MSMEYFRCKACRTLPYKGLLARTGYGDLCIVCNGPIAEHEEAKRYAKEVKLRNLSPKEKAKH